MKRAILWLFAIVVLAALGWAAFRLNDERNFAAAPFGEGARWSWSRPAPARTRWRSCSPTPA